MAAFSSNEIAAANSAPQAFGQLPPLERHETFPDDKVLFELVPVHLLACRVQGPGRLGDLIRAARLAR